MIIQTNKPSYIIRRIFQNILIVKFQSVWIFKKSFGNFQSWFSQKHTVYFQIKMIFYWSVFKSWQIRKLTFGKLKSRCLNFVVTLTWSSNLTWFAWLLCCLKIFMFHLAYIASVFCFHYYERKKGQYYFRYKRLYFSRICCQPLSWSIGAALTLNRASVEN